MGSKTIVKIGPLEYEPEVLNALTEESTVLQTQVDLWDFVSKKWNYSEEKGEYLAVSRKEKRERTIFNNLYFYVRAIWASDKNGVFESPEELFELGRNDHENFMRLYNAAIKANPGLKKVETKDKEGASHPN